MASSHKGISTFLVVLMLSLLFGQDVGADIQISNPTAGTVWQPGSQGLISWSGSTPATNVNINLKNGPSGNLQTVLQIASGINPNTQSSFTWNIPTTIATGTYAIEIGTAPPNLYYSDQFTISSGSSSTGQSSTSSSSASSTSSGSTSSSSTTTTTTTSTKAHPPAAATINLSGNSASHNGPLNILPHLCISGFVIFLSILHL